MLPANASRVSRPCERRRWPWLAASTTRRQRSRR
jgi:hypothetical protein